MWRMECEDTLQFMPELTNSLTLIVSGTNEEDVAKGWENLRELEESSVLGSCVDLEDARSIMRGILRGGVLNVHQVPKLMVYFAKYVKKKNAAQVNEGDRIVDDYVAFVMLAGDRDVALLVSMVEILRDYPIYRGSCVATAKACRAVVTALGTFQMPKSSNEVVHFRESANKIRESLRLVCKSRDGSANSDLVTICLETVYGMISDTERATEPGPGLIAVLELVEAKYIGHAVKWIMSEPRSDRQLERALRVLCHWIPNWLSVEHLSRWIMEFITGLENAKKYSILDSVAKAYLNNILLCVIFPMSSQHATLLVTAILCRQPNPVLFHKLIRVFKMVFEQLRRQKTEVARSCLQDLVDVTKALIERYPGYPCYDELEKSFPVEPRIQNVISLRDERVWSDEPAYESFSTCNEIATTSLPCDHGKVGLTNLGNTCYMNSVLQALAMTRQFSQEVMRYKCCPRGTTDMRDSSSVAASAEQAAQIMPKLRDLFALLAFSPRRSLSPSEILVASRPEYFAPRQQQDSSEFLCHLLDVLYEQEKSLLRKWSIATDESTVTRAKCKRSGDLPSPDRGCIKRWTTEEDLSEGISLERKTSQSLGDFGQGDEVDDQIGQTQVSEALSDCHSDSTDSGIQSVDGRPAASASTIDEATRMSRSILVHRVFGGESRITYQCAQCDTSSDNTDRFRDLQLCFPEEISDNQEVTVQDLMNYYLTPEKLTGENKYRCDRCRKLCDAQRIIKILRAPSHLILTLKHFRYDAETRLRTKLRHRVMYDETIKLPVAPIDATATTMMTCAAASPIAETYRLYAAVVHSGYSMDYGHYVTYARDSKQNWFKFNDSFVSRTSLDDFKALEPPVTPYILFYERLSDNADESRDRRASGDLDDNVAAAAAGADDEAETPDLSTLSEHVRDLVAKDRRDYEDEIRSRADKKRAKRSIPTGHAIAPSLRRHDNSDDENPPPSSCRGPIDIPTNRFLF